MHSASVFCKNAIAEDPTGQNPDVSVSVRSVLHPRRVDWSEPHLELALAFKSSFTENRTPARHESPLTKEQNCGTEVGSA